MKPFRFTLEAVLTLRKSEEQTAKEAYAKVQLRLQQLLANHRKIEQEVQTAHELKRQSLSRSVSSEWIQQLQAGLSVLQGHLKQSQVEVQLCQGMLDQKWRAVLEARRKREMVEKLEQKQLTEHQANLMKEEQAFLDEIAILRAGGDFPLKVK